LQRLLTRGLTTTAALWPPLRLTYGWVHQAAHVLANEAGLSGDEVRRDYAALRTQMAARQAAAGTLSPAVDHFLKVTRSYGPHLFHCYDVPDLPRTNNDLEQYFGAARYHQRRASGRKRSPASTVVRGAVRLVAAVVARSRHFAALDLWPRDLTRWRHLRQALEHRAIARRTLRRFRRDPAAYLHSLEAQLPQVILPP
jgi:hypothetical protein